MYLMFGQVGNLDEFQNADIRPRFLKGELKGVIEDGPLIHVINDERRNSI